MSRQYYVETTPDGRHQFVSLRRSRSHGHHHDDGHHHHHHHHRHRHHHDLADVTKDEWNSLVERERCLKEANETLTRENHALVRDNQTLKANLQSGDAELRRLQAWIPHLEHTIQDLRAENLALRRSLDAAHDAAAGLHAEADKLRKRAHRLERENDGLLARVRELTRQCQEGAAARVAELKEAVAAWRRKFEDAEARLVRLRREHGEQAHIIAEQSERLSVYERILRRHGLLY